MRDPDPRRPSPQALLRQVEAEERRHRRGKLKVFLGYASGVGKSFRMFDEGRRRKQRGQDVVVAATQPEAAPAVEELLESLEVIPARVGPVGQSIDVPAILKRAPAVCLIDGLAYENPPGAKNRQRWQDVEELLAAGVSVVTTVNLQYILERQEQVEAIRGRKVKDSVPESFLRTADEIEVVDAPPEYCVTPREDGGPRTDRQLAELREIALVLAADVVDHQLEQYLRDRGVEQSFGTHERILVCLTPRSNASLMLKRGKRQADRFHGELYAAYVDQGELAEADRAILSQNLEAARALAAKVEILHGEDAITAILQFAERQGITQIFVGHSPPRGWLAGLRTTPVERLILESGGIDVRIFPHSSDR